MLFCEPKTCTATMFPQYFQTTKKDKSFNINKALVIVLRSNRKGYSAACKVFASLNLSLPVHQWH